MIFKYNYCYIVIKKHFLRFDTSGGGGGKHVNYHRFIQFDTFLKLYKNGVFMTILEQEADLLRKPI